MAPSQKNKERRFLLLEDLRRYPDRALFFFEEGSGTGCERFPVSSAEDSFFSESKSLLSFSFYSPFGFFPFGQERFSLFVMHSGASLNPVDFPP